MVVMPQLEPAQNAQLDKELLLELLQLVMLPLAPLTLSIVLEPLLVLPLVKKDMS
jgi:hypothetical protein